jgi:MoaA/NifB/PqqE/SkfB family radical SAM enzyme
MTRYARYFQYLFYKKNALPVYLVHFLTNDCNANCLHCLRYGLETPSDNELSLQEVEKISRQLGEMIYSVTLTGGEALLRNDVKEIAAAYLRNSNIKTLQILSNGSMTNRMTGVAEHLATRFPDKSISFTLSLDGIGSEHDRLRRFPGLFEKAVQSYCRTQALRKKCPNLNIGFSITVTSANQNNVIRLYNYLDKELKADLLKATLVRGKIECQSLKTLDLKHYKKLCLEMEKRAKMSDFPRNLQDLILLLVEAQDIKARQRVSNTVEGSKYIAPCYAGTLSGVIFANGDVGPCELIDQKFGNLRNHRYSLRSVWKTHRAVEVRKKIFQSKCYCTYECAMICNILFNIFYMPSLLKTAARIWQSQWATKAYRLKGLSLC